MGYNLSQQAFALSMYSNQLVKIAGNTPDSKASLENRLLEYLNKALEARQAEMGKWDIVWGPAVFVNLVYQQSHDDKGIADNVLFVARKQSSPPVYVVATAGTNKYSKYGRDVEDGDVANTTTWAHAFKGIFSGFGNPPGSGTPCLSKGTALGVQALLTTVPEGKTNPSDPNPVTIDKFLAHVPSAGATLIFTGHSLGGALAPALALALFNKVGGPLDKDSWGVVHTLPTAGATPGNNDFVGAFKDMFTPSTDGEDPSKGEVWNWDIANPKDFVPMAWIPSEMAAVPPPVSDAKGGLYPDLQWRNNELKQRLKDRFDQKEKDSNDGANSRPEGALLGTKAGAYTRLPSIVGNCTEIDPTDKIGSLALPTRGDWISYVDHWLKQHSTAYVQQIFNAGPLMYSDPAELLGGAAASLLADGEGSAD